MIEVYIKIDGKEYTREQAVQLYQELADFLGKSAEKIIERVVAVPAKKRNIFDTSVIEKPCKRYR